MRSSGEGELWQHSATELIRGYRARDFSPREVLEALAGRIAGLDSQLGAFTELSLERARAEADAATEAYGRRTPVERLAGVPFAAKDMFDTADVRTSYGSSMFAHHVPARDAAAVASLRAAGAILLGKTQTHEFAWGLTSINALGTSRNPWRRERISGGSSGGSAVALAAGLTPLALGSDTGGSVRIPAGFCGILGFKPTYGRLDTEGLWPLAPSLDHVGLMARTPEDVALLLDVLGDRPERARARLGPPALDGVTAIVCPELHAVTPSPEVELTYRRTLARLERLGARIVERSFPAAPSILESFAVIQPREAVQVHRDSGLFPARLEGYGDDVRARLERGATVDGESYVRASAQRELLRAAFGRLLAGDAVLLTPISTVSPLLADPGPGAQERDAAFRRAVLPYTTPQDLLGLPAAVLRAGFDALDVPIGMQITGAPWREEAVLRVVAALQRATPEVQGRWPDVESSS